MAVTPTTITIGNAHLGTAVLTTPQLQRAWALGYVRLVFPGADLMSVERMAAWVYGEGITS